MNTIKLDYSDVKFADNGKLKLLIIVGTRPEIIRLAAVIMKCRRYFNTVLAHTGQNYDYNLNGIFFKVLSLDDPEVFMKGAAAGAGQNALLESYGERICKDDLEPGFFVDFFIKDMKLAYDSAKLGGLELDVLGRVIENYQQLSDAGLGRAGMQALIKHYEK